MLFGILISRPLGGGRLFIMGLHWGLGFADWEVSRGRA